MDQVPLPFSPGTNKTLNIRGEACHMKEPAGSSATKRFCTLQITICAQADQQNVKLEIIFRGQGLQLSALEQAHFASLPNVIVRFQENAWADERITMEWMETFRGATLEQGEVCYSNNTFCQTIMLVI
jgi:hypothetical protein